MTGESDSDQPNPNPKRRPRSQKPKSVQNWERARDRIKQKADDEQFALDCKSHPLFQISVDIIEYADDPLEADRLADILSRAVEANKNQFIFFGFDLEGDADTLQIYTKLGGREFPLMFQLSLINDNEQLPNKLRVLLNNKRIVFIGKNSRKDAIDFFNKFNFPDERKDEYFYVDTLHLIRFCCVFGRDNIDDAVTYCQNGHYLADPDRILRPLDKPFEEYGLYRIPRIVRLSH